MWETFEQGGDMRLAARADLEFHMTIINTSQNGMFITIGGAVKAALLQASRVRLLAMMEDLGQRG